MRTKIASRVVLRQLGETGFRLAALLTTVCEFRRDCVSPDSQNETLWNAEEAASVPIAVKGSPADSDGGYALFAFLISSPETSRVLSVPWTRARRCNLCRFQSFATIATTGVATSK